MSQNIYGAVAAANAKGSIMRYSKDGGTHRIPNISNIALAGGEAEEITVDALAEDDASFVGRPGVEGMTVDFNAFPIAHESFVDLIESKSDGEPLQFEIVTAPAMISPPSTARAAIATTGVVTFTGDGNPRLGNVLKVGHVLAVGNDIHKVDRFTGTPGSLVANVRPVPGSAVAASAYRYGIPIVTFQFAATVRQVGNLVFGTNAAISGTLLLTPTAPLPTPAFSVPAA